MLRHYVKVDAEKLWLPARWRDVGRFRRAVPPLGRAFRVQAAANHYHVLGLRRTASKVEIKSAFRELAKKHHPDVNHLPDAEQRFKLIKEAYETLANNDTRSAYDSSLGVGRRHAGYQAVKGKAKRRGPAGSPLWNHDAAGQGRRNEPFSGYSDGSRSQVQERWAALAEALRHFTDWQDSASSKPTSRHWKSPYERGSDHDSWHPYASSCHSEFQAHGGSSWRAPQDPGPGSKRMRQEGWRPRRGDKWRFAFPSRPVSLLGLNEGPVLFLPWLCACAWSLYGAQASLACLTVCLLLSPEAASGYKAAGAVGWLVGGSAGLGVVLALYLLLLGAGNVCHEGVGILALGLWIGGQAVARWPIPSAAVTLMLMDGLGWASQR